MARRADVNAQPPLVLVCQAARRQRQRIDERHQRRLHDHPRSWTGSAASDAALDSTCSPVGTASRLPSGMVVSVCW
jgi:hypothetical protein